VAPIVTGVCYDIYLLQVGFRPLAVVGKIVQKQAGDSYVRKEKKYAKQHGNTGYTK